MSERKSICLPGYDYTQPGAFFITIVIDQRKTILSTIQDQAAHLTPVGEMVRSQWEQLAARFRSIEIGEFVIMPNHHHGILVIKDSGTGETIKMRQAYETPVPLHQRALANQSKVPSRRSSDPSRLPPHYGFAE